MRKNILAKSIATMIGGIALIGGAHAAVITDPTPPAGVAAATVIETNRDGLGHQLFVPYYTVQGDNVTLFSLVNTDTMNGKAVKLRFRGAQNSDDVYDVTLLLSPGDVWNAAITRGDDGIARVATQDKTCTLPLNVNQSFVTARLNGDAAARAAGTREGYIEMFNMADIPPGSALFTAIKHVNGVPPGCSSAATNALFTDPTDAADAAAKGLGAPTTGLTANWTIYNGPQAVSWAGDAVATEARVSDGGVPGFGNIVFFPQSATLVPIASVKTFTSDPILRGGVADNSGILGAPGAAPVQAAMFDFPDMSTPYLNSDAAVMANGVATRRQAYRLTRALAVTSVMNEYITVSALAARTDWTFSSPTRRYNVARNYAGAGNTLYTNYAYDDADVVMANVTVPPAATVVAPDNYFEPTSATGGNISADANGVLCVSGVTFAADATSPVPQNLIGGTTTDQEERFTASTSDFVISPGTPAVAQRLCGEVSVLSFNAGLSQPSVLGASLTRLDLTSAFTAGWLRIATPGLPVAAGQGLGASTRQGLPLVGHAVTQFTNNNALAGGSTAGTIGNYDQTLVHRNTRY